MTAESQNPIIKDSEKSVRVINFRYFNELLQIFLALGFGLGLAEVAIKVGMYNKSTLLYGLNQNPFMLIGGCVLLACVLMLTVWNTVDFIYAVAGALQKTKYSPKSLVRSTLMVLSFFGVVYAITAAILLISIMYESSLMKMLKDLT